VVGLPCNRQLAVCYRRFCWAVWAEQAKVQSLLSGSLHLSHQTAPGPCVSCAAAAAGPIMLQGPTMDPHIASELLMRLPHLPLRMAEHCKRAAAMSQMLHNMGAKVRNPLAGFGGAPWVARVCGSGQPACMYPWIAGKCTQLPCLSM